MDFESERLRLRVENDVIHGLDENLFLLGGSNDNLEFCAFKRFYDGVALKTFRDLLYDLQSRSHSRDIRHCNVIFPNKETVCWDEHPFRDVLLEPQSPGRILKSMDSDGKILFHSPQDCSLFLKRDTHFSPAGILRWCFAVCDCLGVFEGLVDARDQLRKVIHLSSFEHEGDLGGKLNAPTLEVFQAFRPPAHFQKVSNGISNRGFMEVIRNDKAPIPRRLLIFGDSFLRQARYYYAAWFQSVVFVHTHLYCPDLIDLFEPHFIVHGIVERFLNRPPDNVIAPCPYDQLPALYGKQQPIQDLRPMLRATGLEMA